MISFLEELFDKRGSKSLGYDEIRYIELVGGTVIEPMAYEPDATTHRESHYYNAKTNTLYRKIVSKRIGGLVVSAYWQKVSQ